MLAISFLELLPESMAKCGIAGTVTGFAIGLLTMAALESLIPRRPKGPVRPSSDREELERASVLMILGIFLHNLPEGMAIASAGSMEDPRALVAVALAIAIHNIPEGICTSAPYYQATGKRLRAFLWSASTALPMLAGYLLGKTLLRGLSPYAMGVMVASVAGLMIHISCSELLPAALEEEGREHPIRPMLWLTAGILLVLGLTK